VPPDIPFTAGEKMNATLPDNATALDYLKLYFTDEIMDVIVEQTNKYAEQYIAKNVIKPSITGSRQLVMRWLRFSVSACSWA